MLSEARGNTPAAHEPGTRAGPVTSPRLPHRSRIESVGCQLPEGRLSTRELMASCRRGSRVDLERLTGIRSRRVCGDGEDSYTLAVDAALDCLARSSCEAPELELVISTSITRYRGTDCYVFEPPASLVVKEAIGASQAQNFDLTNACAGMLTGVIVLDDFIRRGVVRRGLVVSGESITSLSDNAVRTVRTVFSKQLASLTVGDSGAAVILECAENGSEGIGSCQFVTFAEHSDLCIGKAAPRGPGAAMYTNPRKLHKEAIGCSTPSIRRALEEAGVAWGEIDWVIPHQTSVRAIRAGERHICGEFGARPTHIVENLEEVGNTSSTTHFLALHRLLEERRIQKGDRAILLAFASGLVVGGLIFTMDELAEHHARTN